MKAHDLERFTGAQESDYLTALRELRSGRKRSHWIWYIFPQLKGLGSSQFAEYYGLSGIEEARAYAAHPILAARLEEITKVLLELPDRKIEDIFGYPDYLKVHSCMTLFDLVSPESLYASVLNRYFKGKKDKGTLGLLGL